MQKVAVIGLDGCSWSLLEPWIEAGMLPTLKRLREAGAWGSMESCLPPVTSPNWQCYATGMNPGQLGVFWWENVDFRAQKIVLAGAHLFDGIPLWNYLGQAGYRVMVVNFPTVYPPSEVEGVLIAGGPDALDHDFTYPPELESELKRRYGYRVHSSLIDFIDDPDQKERVAQDIIRIIQSRFAVAQDMIAHAPPDFLHLTIYYINVLQHHFWDDPVVLTAWQTIDAGIAQLMDALQDWQFLLMVDHGTNQIRVKFNISTWLQEQGYLVTRPDLYGSLAGSLGLTRERLTRWAARLRVKDGLKRLFGAAAKSVLPSEGGVVRVEARQRIVDWGKTSVIASGQGPVYVNPELPELERQQFLNRLQRELEDLTDEQGYPIARQVLRKEDVYSGPYLDQAPDLIIDQNDGVHIAASVGFTDVFEPPRKWFGENSKVGLFGALGPEIEPGQLEHQVKILDLAPTILHIYGLPIPSDMHGRVLHELFAVGSPLHKRRPRRGDGGDSDQDQKSGPRAEEEEIIAKRLRSLGYL